MVSELHYKIILLVLLMALTALPGLSQDINKPEVVTGVVLADEEPVIGATVRLKGTDIGAATDYDGRFRLKAPVGSTLEIQYIGMDTVEVKVDGKPLVIRMVPPKFWCAWVCNFGYCGKVPEGLFGRVYDSNARVLPGAIVKVLPSCLSTTTDGKGDFHIQVAEGDTILRVEHPDYEPRQGKIAGNEFVISLDPSPVMRQVSLENNQSSSGVTEADLLTKMESLLNRTDGQNELSNQDIADICYFSIHNYDACLSEAVGYELYHLLRNNPSNNRAFKSCVEALQSEKCEILSALIALMSIDILENSYDSFESFVREFPLFEDEECASKTFAEVKENELMESNREPE